MRGILSLMGSGELAPSMVATHRQVLEAVGADRVTVLDTPFGFQENADQLTERIASHFRTSLSVDVEVASLRGPAAEPGPTARFLAAIRRARYVFAGPGSPSYALRVWRPAGVGPALVDVLTGGGAVVLASAAALTAGRSTLPVYEIYKVGEDPHWLEGLDLTGALGVPATVIPHWNNAEGGNHDTSRCYIGERRLRLLEPQLETGILGVDEHTAATLHPDRMEVTGVGGVTLRAGGTERRVESGAHISPEDVARALDASGAEHDRQPHRPAASPGFAEALSAGDADAAVDAILSAEGSSPPDRGRLRAMIAELGRAAQRGLTPRAELVGGFVELACELRARRREAGDYAEADMIRDRLADLGVEVRDTPEGWEWKLRDG